MKTNPKKEAKKCDEGISSCCCHHYPACTKDCPTEGKVCEHCRPPEPQTKQAWELLRCSTCRKFKPCIAYQQNKLRTRGYDYTCKECYKIVDATRYYRNREQRLIKEKKRYEKMSKEKIAERSRFSKERNPEKWKARQDLRNAITKGTIKRLPCEVCHKPKAHAHHEDYAKPFEVKWLCQKHHGELHRKYDADKLITQRLQSLSNPHYEKHNY
jgi:hypothetical protein